MRKIIVRMKNDFVKRMFAGLVAGAVCGLFGGGGGAVVVAVMTLILGYGQKTAHATACAVMLP
ncbi:MAG: hypothetical protein ILP02_02970, partial [Clostridia bacterium]|nr:hypothetical protein [Clostridia bacterium]